MAWELTTQWLDRSWQTREDAGYSIYFIREDFVNHHPHQFKVSVLLLLLVLLWAGPGTAANLSPLGLQDAQVLPKDWAEVRFGMSYSQDLSNFFQEDDHGRDVAETPALQFNVGLGDRVEGQLAYSLLIVDRDDEDSDLGSGDLTLGIKVRLMREDLAFPAIGVRIAVKLPEADDDQDFGTDQTDVFLQFLATRNYQGFSVYGNLGLAILGDPDASQDDKMMYGFGVRVPLGSETVNLLASVEGTEFGESVNDRGAALAGFQFHFGDSTLDLGGSVGYRSHSEDWGLRAGLTTRFNLPPGW